MFEPLETPIHSPEKKLVLKAISDFAGKITVADIATKTALPILQAASFLNQIAYETGGHLTVGTAGNIVYEFDRNFESAYLTRGSKSFFKRAGRVIYNALAYAFRIFALVMFFVIRVSFGILLVLSVVLIVVLVVAAVMALLAKLMGDDNDSAPDLNLGGIFDGFGGIARYWAFDWLWDWWYWGNYLRWDPTPSYYGSVPTSHEPLSFQPDANAGKRKDSESFLDKCFSYLFGDGDPNAGLAERYWQTLAQVLKANGGVVIAEQLAPYATVQGKNEDWVLPILVRFNGTCEVTDSGKIVYCFPSFQQKVLEENNARSVTYSSPNASSTQPEELHALFRKHIESQKAAHDRHVHQAHLETYFREHLWELSHVTGGSRTTIICFAAFILLGSLWLTTITITLPFLLPFVPLLFAMAGYGAMFLIVPAIRSLFVNKFNADIEKRNSVRFTASTRIQNPDAELQHKLNEADSLRHAALEASRAEEIAYSTDKDLLDQQFENKNLDGDIATQAKKNEHKPEHRISLAPEGDDAPEHISTKKNEDSQKLNIKKKTLENLQQEADDSK